ncbi:hypothetical protein [Actinophytocola sp.]
MRWLAGVLALVPVLMLGTACRDETAPTPPVDNVESTLDAIESELAGD